MDNLKETLERELQELDRAANGWLADHHKDDPAPSQGGYVAPIPADHWSLSPEWQARKAMAAKQTNDTAAVTEQPTAGWASTAAALGGHDGFGRSFGSKFGSGSK